MLGLTLEQTRVYQEAIALGREQREAEMLKLTVPLLLKTGMTVSQIAQQLNVDVEAVQRAAQLSERKRGAHTRQALANISQILA